MTTRVQATLVILLPVSQDVPGELSPEAAAAVAGEDPAGLGGVAERLREHLLGLASVAVEGAPHASWGVAQAQYLPGDLGDVAALLARQTTVARLLQALASGDGAAAIEAFQALTTR